MKKIHRFLLQTPLEITETQTATISDARVVHQIISVLRIKNGEQCIFFSNNTADTVVTITEQQKHFLTVRIDTILTKTIPQKHIIAVVSIPKGDAFEIMTQKLTELGVSEIVPLLADRTVKQSVRIDRLQSISDEALEQCGGNNVVFIHEPKTVSQCLQQFPFTSFFGDPRTTPESIKNIPAQESLVLYIGPEGGWSDEEEITLKEAGVLPLWLSDRILRTETAAIIGVHTLLQ